MKLHWESGFFTAWILVICGSACTVREAHFTLANDASSDSKGGGDASLAGDASRVGSGAGGTEGGLGAATQGDAAGTAADGSSSAAGEDGSGDFDASGATEGSGGFDASGATEGSGGFDAGSGNEESGVDNGSGGYIGGVGGSHQGGAGGVRQAGGAGPGNGGAGPGTGGAGLGGAGVGGAGVGGAGNTGGVSVQLAQTEQTMDGFGISDVWANPMTSADADALFSPTSGLGLSILRVGMAPDGGAMASSTYDDINLAKERGVTTVIASVWTAPASCKGNGSVNNGGHLLSSCYESWATTIASFATKVRQNTNVDLYAMSLQSEPDFASCGATEPCNGDYTTMVYTAKELVDFVKVAAPKLRAAGVKVIAPEPSQWLHLWSNESATGSEPSGKPSSDPLHCGFPATNCTPGNGYDYGHALYADTEAWAALDLLGVHQYYTQVAEPWPTNVPDRKPIWTTEMSGIKWWPEQGPSSTIDNGIAVAGWIHDALVNGSASAWLWWYYRAVYTDDNEGLILKSGTDTKRHYTVGNYSRFIRPGYVRVAMTGTTPSAVLASAYKGADGTIVIVVINKGASSVAFPIVLTGGTAPASVTPWVTSASDNLVAKAAVTLAGGSFTASLSGRSVTTFVGR